MGEHYTAVHLPMIARHRRSPVRDARPVLPRRTYDDDVAHPRSHHHRHAHISARVPRS
ncbi:hypothetical protein GCM10010529_26980 [Nesterenkonia aethiopica]|uniref:Uncharacterized protein n=1 Tax=Nesterenkonia aethiopica TaxID=269144 RepID=A0ABP6M2J7_9MICC